MRCNTLMAIGAIGLGTLALAPAKAQSITYLNRWGQQIGSWKDGDRITVLVQGGRSNATWVEILRQTGYAGAWPLTIYSGPYSPNRGLRYTFTANYSGYVSITTWVKTNPYNGYITGKTLWKNQR